ncbi:MAG: glutamine synthetase family protein [Pseudorhodoplanes sp.]
MSFVERHGLWSDEQQRRAREIEQQLDTLDLVRFVFADQHGVLRGKTMVASQAAKLMRNGVSMTTTLLAKDTSHRTVFPVFTPGGGFAMPEMQGAADFLMIADPITFRVLPWATNTGWVQCDLHFQNGKPVPFSTRQLCRDALSRLRGKGFDFLAGLEVEFHLYRIENPRLAPEDATWPGEPAEVSYIHQGFQLLTEARSDQIEPLLEPFWRAAVALGLPFQSLEVELGPSQCEFTFRPVIGLEAADMMVLFRSAMKQIARRQGLHCTFMCRPGLPNAFSSGWHLHQSLLDAKTGANAFVSQDADEVLSPLARSWLAGLLANAKAAAAFTTPTVNGYKRYRAYALAPDRVIWGQDNRGVMVRAIGRPGDAATHLENRIGEPAANPYLYLASQVASGLDGVARDLVPPPSADRPYETEAEGMPKNLGEALDALRTSTSFRQAFGDGFVDYYLRIKDAEVVRYRADEKTDAPEISRWEQKEYFDLY